MHHKLAVPLPVIHTKLPANIIFTTLPIVCLPNWPTFCFISVMKVAIPTWSGGISPVFDVSRYLLVVDIERGEEISRHEEEIRETELARRAQHIIGLGVNVLICGAISWPLERMLVSEGVQVIPQTCGPVKDVLLAFVSGQLKGQAFLMPGCCGRHRRRRGQLRRS